MNYLSRAQRVHTVGIAISLASAISIGTGPSKAQSIITFTHQATGDLSGSLNSTPFTANSFVITAEGDTSNRVNLSGNVFYIDHTSASINIDGQGVFNFLTPTRTFVNNAAQSVGFSKAGGVGLDLFDGPSSFPAWDELTSIGPIAGSGSILQWNSGDINTSGGILSFADKSVNAVFSATVRANGSTPVPGPLPVLGVSAAFCYSRKLRKRIKSSKLAVASAID